MNLAISGKKQAASNALRRLPAAPKKKSMTVVEAMRRWAFAVAEALGHLSISTTYRYVRRDQTAAREAVQLYEDNFLSEKLSGGRISQVLAQRIRARRLDLGLKQSQVAERASTSAKSIKDYEAGRVEKISIVALAAVARALEMGVEDLVRGLEKLDQGDA